MSWPDPLNVDWRDIVREYGGWILLFGFTWGVFAGASLSSLVWWAMT